MAACLQTSWQQAGTAPQAGPKTQSLRRASPRPCSHSLAAVAPYQSNSSRKPRAASGSSSHGRAARRQRTMPALRAAQGPAHLPG